MNDHFAKPIDPATLFETVGRFYKRAERAAPDRLHQIPDLDASAGLSRVGGNRKLYLKLLRQFVENQGTAVARVTEAQGAGDRQTAERLAHTLKGVAGNIGATEVQFAAGALEKCIRDGAAEKDVETAKRRVAATLDPLVTALRALPEVFPAEDKVNPTTPTSVQLPQSREAAGRLTRLLSEFDPGAADFVEANQAALRPLFGDAGWPEFEKLVQGYAFADAQTRLEQALKGVQGV